MQHLLILVSSMQPAETFSFSMHSVYSFEFETIESFIIKTPCLRPMPTWPTDEIWLKYDLTLKNCFPSVPEWRQDEPAAVPWDRARHGHRHVRRNIQGRPIQGQKPGRTSGRDRQISRCCHSLTTRYSNLFWYKV